MTSRKRKVQVGREPFIRPDDEAKSRKDVARLASRKPSTHQSGSGACSGTMDSSCTVNLSPLFLLVVVIRKAIASVANRRECQRTKRRESGRRAASSAAQPLPKG